MSNQIAHINPSKKGFALQPQNMQEAMQFATMMSGSNLAPKAYKNNPEDTLVAMMMGAEVGLNPMQALQNIAVINGRPSIWGDAMLALVQNHPRFSSISETFDESAMTATCTVQRKGGDKHTVTFSQQDAQAAGLWGKPGPWQQYPKRMIKLRARGFALRDQFADALLGLISAEEAQDMPDGVELVSQKEEVSATKSLPEYTEDQFMENLPAWKKVVGAGKRTPDQLINMIESKYILSESMKQSILNIEQEEQPQE